MLVTTKDAGQLWCPMVRQPVSLQEDDRSMAACNTDWQGSRTQRCAADRCMMWRWSDEATTKPSMRRGYCGLAGVATKVNL